MGHLVLVGSDGVIPFPGRPAHATAEPTFHDLASEWLRTEGARLVEPENERRHIEHLRPIWHLTEAELRPRIVKAVLASLLRPAGPLGAATVNKVRGTGRRIIREAQINDEWMGPNPFDIVRRLRQPKPTYRFLSREEVRALLPHLREDRRREALTMLYLGLRPGELKALRRSDVDLRARVIHIHRSNSRDETKTGKARDVPIPERLVPVLEQALSATPPSSPFVFPGAGGEIQRADTKMTRVLGDALRKAGLVSGYEYSCRRKGCGHREERAELEEVKCPDCGFKLWASGIPIEVRWYDLRHSAATLHRSAGADPLAIQLVLGHAPENVTDSIYTHLTQEDVRREMNRLDL